MKNIKKIVKKILTFVLALAIAASVIPTESVNAAVKLNKTSISLAVSQTAKLKVKGTTNTVKWTSSDVNIAKVSSKGVVTGVQIGTCVIKAKVKVGKKYKTFKCTVKVAELVSITSASQIYVGQKGVIKITTNPSGAAVTYKSNDTSICTVDSDGIITAKAAGGTTITATYLGQTTTFNINVVDTNIKLKSVTYPATGASVTEGDKVTFTVKGSAEYGLSTSSYVTVIKRTDIGAAVERTYNLTTLGSVSSDGSFNVTFTIPVNTPEGKYVIKSVTLVDKYNNSLTIGNIEAGYLTGLDMSDVGFTVI